MDLANYTKQCFHDPESRFTLDLSGLAIATDYRAQDADRFAAIYAAMADLESGAIANPDENRMVGHYWLRNSTLAPSTELKDAIDATLIDIKRFSASVLDGKLTAANNAPFTDLLVIGIGGSALGPQFVVDALATGENGLCVHFLDNTDPAGMDRVFNRICDKLLNTLVLVISKSGGTAETRNGMIETMYRYDTLNIPFHKQAVAITGEGSALSQRAENEGWLAQFPMWDWVGGRTSVMSAVGLLPAALAGIDIDAFLAGARHMDALTRSPGLMENPAALLSTAWYRVTKGHGERDMVILPYKDQLLLFSRYLQQLIMESLGKELDLNGGTVEQGIAVYGNKGSTDQHAYIQQLRDGLDNFFVTFLEVLQDRAGDSHPVDGLNTSGDYLFGFLEGTRAALSEKQRPFLAISIPEVSPFTIGMLIALYERSVGYYATMVNINAYHQPGVEAGKRAAGGVLDLQQRVLQHLQTSSKALGILELVKALRLTAEQEDLLYRILRHLHANGRVTLDAGSFADWRSLRFTI